jgi:hypothetical protein
LAPANVVWTSEPSRAACASSLELLAQPLYVRLQVEHERLHRLRVRRRLSVLVLLAVGLVGLVDLRVEGLDRREAAPEAGLERVLRRRGAVFLG